MDDFAEYEPGTHKDVWILKQLNTIAIHYPEIKDEVSFLFGSSCLFFDYQTEKQDILDRATSLVQQGKYKVRPNGTNIASVLPSEYAQADRVTMIELAWKRYLKSTKRKPKPNIFPDFYYDFIDHPRVLFDGNNRYGYFHPHYTPGVRALGPLGNYCAQYPPGCEFKNEKEYLNTVSPLSYFPPMAETGMLDEVIFFDPSKTSVHMARIYQQYGPQVGEVITLACSRHGRIIKYSDIIHPSEYGFYVDFRSIGLPWHYNIQFDLFTENHLKRISTLKTRNWRENGNTYNNFAVLEWYFPWNEKYASRYFQYRDRWIQSWLLNGVIPTSKGTVVEQKNVKRLSGDIELADYYMKDRDVEDFYPVTIKPKQDYSELYGALFGFGKMAVAVAAAAYTGQYSAITATLASQIVTTIIELIPDFDGKDELNLALTMVISALLVENKTDADPQGKSAEIIIQLGASEINKLGAMARERFDGDIEELVRDIDNSLTDKEKLILAAIAQIKDPGFEDVVKASSNNVFQARDAFSAKVDKDSQEGIIKIGAAALAAAAIYKLIK